MATGFLVALVLVAVLFTLTGAGILILACKLLGQPIPKFSRACFVSFLSLIAYLAFSMVIRMAMLLVIVGVPGPEDPTPADSAGMIAMFQLMSLGMSLVFWALVSGVIYKVFVPIQSFGKAMAVVGVTFLVWLAIFVVVYLVVAAYLTATGAGV